MAASSSTTSFVVVEPFSASESSTSSENDGRMVRFDNECVLIPEYTSRKGPRVVTKSYSLPLWKRRGAAVSDSEGTDDPSSSTSAPLLSSSPDETHVVLRVPIPSIVRRPSRSPNPSRGASARSLSMSPTIPLTPCLVQRVPSSPASETRSTSFLQSPSRRTPHPVYQRRQDDQTVPLRACCPDCFRITDQSSKEGSTWQEKFTKGARRRRSASLDSASSSGAIGVGSAISAGGMKGAFTPGSFDDRMPPPTLSITVDEVDKRRRSQESTSAAANAEDDSEGTRSGSSFSRSTTLNRHDRDHFADSLLSDSSSDLSQSHTQLLSQRKASPIAEEDESELFPLPSPRRSPTGSSGSSPRLSPRTSPRTSPGVSPKPSPGPSPNTSSSCLHPNSAALLAATLREKAKSRSKESVSSEELLVSNGISRKPGDVSTPPQSGASTPRANKPRPLSLTLNFPTMRKSSANSETVTPSNSNGDNDTAPNTPVSPSADAGLSSSLTSTSTMSSMASSQPKSPVTPSSPRFLSSPKTSRKLSFGLPFLKAGEAIKGAGAEVLRGVSSISGGGGGLHLGSV
ncbi:hypothetical protein D9756_004374 [Leucocoprinus leucothites]|uniref:Uncharacterized protein n=1 Tax=Leucocoprinus leucothites TaxID=201217 RepID=A0A8H5DA11_9AGAR|nr:hypothetical protein D9756_004374 [Leucoagaricus leucothites]